MSRYIDADALSGAMYHEAFETDTELQRWDSGCWIRYKLFQDILKQQPTADVVEIVRCKDCIFGEKDNEFPSPEAITKINNVYLCHFNGSDRNMGEHFCSYGERVEHE